MEDPKCELAGPFGTIPQELWHPRRVRHNAKPVPLSSSLWEYAHLYKLKISQNSGELPPLREIFLSIKRNYDLLTYIKLYCHLSTLCLSVWSFVVFLFWTLCISVTKNLRSITVGIKIWHKPDFWLKLIKHKPILLLEKLSKTLRQKTLTNSKIFHVLEVLSFKEYDKGKAIQTWVGKICFVLGADYLTKGANLIILNADKFRYYQSRYIRKRKVKRRINK